MNTVLVAVLSAIGGAAGSTIFAWFMLGAKRLSSLTKVIKALSHDALFSRCESLLNKGTITTDELENLDMLFDAYSGLGMNGAGKELYTRCKSLPFE